MYQVKHLVQLEHFYTPKTAKKSPKTAILHSFLTEKTVILALKTSNLEQKTPKFDEKSNKNDHFLPGFNELEALFEKV